MLFQTLLTAETAAMKDEEGRTVLLTAAEMGRFNIYLFISAHLVIHNFCFHFDPHNLPYQSIVCKSVVLTLFLKLTQINDTKINIILRST